MDMCFRVPWYIHRSGMELLGQMVSLFKTFSKAEAFLHRHRFWRLDCLGLNLGSTLVNHVLWFPHV